MLFSCIALAGPNQLPVAPTKTATEPSTVLLEQIGFVMSLIVPLMITLVVVAAVVYAIGQMFGAETRARATTWAKSMLMAVGVAAALIAVLFFFVNNQYQLKETDIDKLVNDLKNYAETALVGMVMLLVVLSALTYAMGQMAGAETRARASVWATGILSGALLAAVLYILIFHIFTGLEATFFKGLPHGLEYYGPVIMSVAFFVTVVILITYLVSKVLQHPEWEAYLSVELTNLTGSFLVLLFVLGLFGVGSLFSLMIAQDANAPQAAIKFMTIDIANNVLEGMYDIFRIQTCASMLSMFARRIGEAVLTNVFKVFPGVDVFVNITNVIGYGLVSIYGSLQAQIALLSLVDKIMVPFFLPAGLVLRFFPPTRDAGSFLIAVAFAFQFVFPLTYLVNKLVVDDLGVKTYEKQRSEALIQSLCGPVKYGVFGVLLNPAAITSLTSFGPISLLFKTLLSETTLNLLSMAEFVPILRSLAVLSLFALFIPAFALVITLAFINAMTKFLTQKVT